MKRDSIPMNRSLAWTSKSRYDILDKNPGLAKSMERGKVIRAIKSARRLGEIPDLSGVDLRGVDLSGVDLRGANLSQANLEGSKLCRATLLRTNLTEANLNEADFSNRLSDECMPS